MVDDKTLALFESAMTTGDSTEIVEVIRNARRYLALRDAGVIIQLQSEEWLFAGKLDAAADRLLENES